MVALCPLVTALTALRVRSVMVPAQAALPVVHRTVRTTVPEAFAVMLVPRSTGSDAGALSSAGGVLGPAVSEGGMTVEGGPPGETSSTGFFEARTLSVASLPSVVPPVLDAAIL